MGNLEAHELLIHVGKTRVADHDHSVGALHLLRHTDWGWVGVSGKFDTL